MWKKKRSEWWNQRYLVSIKEKNVVHGRVKQNRAERNELEYKARCRFMNERVKQCKLRVDEE